MKPSDFCVIILSHGRPNDQATVNTLKRFGYSGHWYILLDNEDATIDEYMALYGADKVKVFNKQAEMAHVDAMDNFGIKKTVVYARSASYKLAKSMGYEYFMMCEDDHDSVRWRMDSNIQYSSKLLSDRHDTLDRVIYVMLEYFKDNPRIKTLCMAQSGDYIGGSNSRLIVDQYRRKAMGTFITRTSDPIKFAGTMNDDTNAYTSLASAGDLMLTTGFIAINTKETQKNKGGNTDIYESFGTYVKSFYSVMSHPSGVRISTIFNKGDRVKNNVFRVHHRVDWKYVAPKVVSESVKKT